MREWLRRHVADGGLLFLLLPVVYFFLYGSEGFADTDQGFVPALAWRVKSGQIPYLDFVYVRPPLTPVLHALELWIWPLEWQMLGMRLDFYLMMAASVGFSVLSLRRWIDFQAWGLSPWWLACLGFLFAAHNFPAMPWHTVDGIFFGTLGLWLVSHPKLRWQMVAGLVALALAGMAKQPFLIMLPVGIGMLFFLQPRKVALQVALMGLGILVAASLVLLSILPDGFLQAMASQLTGSTKAEDFFRAGFIGYLIPAAGLGTVGAAIYFLLRNPSKSPRLRLWLGWLMLVGLAMAPFGYWAWAIWKGAFVPPGMGFFHGLFLLGLGYGFWLWKTGNRNGSIGFLAFSSLAWASSLSWGYAFPALFCLPGIIAAIGIAKQWMGGKLTNRGLAILVGVVFSGYFGLQTYPYRDQPRWELVSGAGEVFPQLQGIHTGPENIAKLKELKGFCTGHAGAFVVLPAQPGIHYLMQEVPVVGIDWEHDAEIGLSQMERIHQEMQRPGLVAIVEKSRLDEAHSVHANYGSQVLREVLTEWKLFLSGEFFDVYHRPMTSP